MLRIARLAPGGLIYHVLNRGVGRMTLFRSDCDYAAFLRALSPSSAEGHARGASNSVGSASCFNALLLVRWTISRRQMTTGRRDHLKPFPIP
jgi:hypothetical protein